MMEVHILFLYIHRYNFLYKSILLDLKLHEKKTMDIYFFIKYSGFYHPSNFISFGSVALPGKMLRVRIIENINIYVYFRSG